MPVDFNCSGIFGKIGAYAVSAVFNRRIAVYPPYAIRRMFRRIAVFYIKYHFPTLAIKRFAEAMVCYKGLTLHRLGIFRK